LSAFYSILVTHTRINMHITITLNKHTYTHKYARTTLVHTLTKCTNVPSCVCKHCRSVSTNTHTHTNTHAPRSCTHSQSAPCVPLCVCELRRSVSTNTHNHTNTHAPRSCTHSQIAPLYPHVCVNTAGVFRQTHIPTQIRTHHARAHTHKVHQCTLMCV